MRTVYDTNGSNVTSTVASFLRANRTLYICDLMMVSSWVWWGSANLNPQYMNFYFSFGDFPVSVGNVQTGPNTVSPITTYGTTRPATFLPLPMTRDKLEYGIGFTANNLSVTWYAGNSLVPIPIQSTMAFGSGISVGPPFFSTGLSAPVALNVTPGGKIRVDWLGGMISTFYPSVGLVLDGFGDPSSGAGKLAGWFLDRAGKILGNFFLLGNSSTFIAPANSAQLLIATNLLAGAAPAGNFMVGVSGDGITSTSGYPTWAQAFSAGMFDECPVYIYRAFFSGDPKQGGQLLGTALMFRGFIRESEAAQDHITLSLSSLMDMFQQVQVPTQIVQPGNRTTPYVPSGINYTINGLNSGLSTQSTLAFNNTLPSPPADHALQDGYMLTSGNSTWTPVNGQPSPIFLRIRDNATIGGVLFLYLYEPTVIPLNNLGNFWAHTGGLGAPSWGPYTASIGVLLQKPLSNSYGAPGFPSVPPPEIGI